MEKNSGNIGGPAEVALPLGSLPPSSLPLPPLLLLVVVLAVVVVLETEKVLEETEVVVVETVLPDYYQNASKNTRKI